MASDYGPYKRIFHVAPPCRHADCVRATSMNVILVGFRELVIWGRRLLRYRVYMISSSHCPVRSAPR